MQYRPLGKTGLMVSVIGMGGVQLNSSSTDYAVRLLAGANLARSQTMQAAHVSEAIQYRPRRQVSPNKPMPQHRPMCYNGSSYSSKGIAPRGRGDVWR